MLGHHLHHGPCRSTYTGCPLRNWITKLPEGIAGVQLVRHTITLFPDKRSWFPWQYHGAKGDGKTNDQKAQNMKERHYITFPLRKCRLHVSRGHLEIEVYWEANLSCLFAWQLQIWRFESTSNVPSFSLKGEWVPIRDLQSSNSERYFWHPTSRAYFQFRISTRFWSKIRNPEFQSRNPDPNIRAIS